MYCLKELRELEAAGGTPTKYKDYVPDNLEVKALLSRDKNITDDLYKAAVADTLIITMKVAPPVWQSCQICHRQRSHAAVGAAPANSSPVEAGVACLQGISAGMQNTG